MPGHKISGPLLKALLGSSWCNSSVQHCLRVVLASSNLLARLGKAALVYASDALKHTTGQQNVSNMSDQHTMLTRLPGHPAAGHHAAAGRRGRLQAVPRNQVGRQLPRTFARCNGLMSAVLGGNLEALPQGQVGLAGTGL